MRIEFQHKGRLQWYAVTMMAMAYFFPNEIPAQRYPFYNINVENGLIQSQARTIAQDNLGHLWIGTLGGLSRYDGNSFTNYTVRDGMSNNTVFSIVADSSGVLWVGGPNGISRFNGKSFRHFILQSPETPAGNNVTQIRLGKDGKVWCIASNKIFSLSKNKLETFDLPDSNAKATALLIDGDGLWIGANGGRLYRYAQGEWDSLSFQAADKFKPNISKIFKDSKGRKWLTTNTGLFRLNEKDITPVIINKTRFDNIQPVFAITEDKQGNLWLGTARGVIKVADSSYTVFNKKNGLCDNSFTSMMTDEEGNVWMASDGQGVFRFSGEQFTSLDESTGLPSAQVMSIAADEKGRLYFGTYEAGLYLYDKGNVSTISMPFKARPAISALRFFNGYLWMGTAGVGLWRYDGNKFKPYFTQNSNLPDNTITSLYTDENQRLLIGTPNGLACIMGDSMKKRVLNNVSVQDFIRIGNDSVLLATTAGLKIFHADTVLAFKTGKAPDSAALQCFAKRGNELWIGSSDNGLIYYNLATKESFVLNKNSGLKSDFVYNVIFDNEGNLWTGTGYGIHKISMKDGKLSVYFYGKGQGISGMESNHNAALKMPDGSIWFGTTNGVVHYRPEFQTIMPEPISIVLQSVKLFGENISDTTYFDSTDLWYPIPYGLKLPYKKNNITFTFHAISLTGGEQVSYRYRMDGLDAPWSDWSDANNITYSALPPGKYVLVVHCSTGQGKEVVKELRYSFEIITPFTKTNLFRLIVLAGCIILGVIIQYIVNRRKQNRLQLVEELRREEQAKVRERTAEDFHDEVGNKLTRINVLTNVLKGKVPNLSSDALRIISQIQDNTGQLYSGTRDILWSLKPANDNLFEILHRIRDFGGELFQDTEVDFIFTGTDEKWKDYRLPLDVSRNLIMIFKEALNNSLKYSKAGKVKLHVALKDEDALIMKLRDDGVGFDLKHTKKGHGIDNMNVRAKRIHGKLEIDSSEGKGTLIQLEFKLTPNKG